MNVLFKCFQCIKDEIDENKEKEKEGFIKFVIHSYSKNKVKEPCKKGRLCKHFSEIELNYETKYGFFTLGWKVYIYNVSVRCDKCKKWLNFANITFNKDKKDYEEVRDCCDNVIAYSANEGKYKCSNEGKKLQKKINQQVKEIQAAEEKLQKLKEEAERLEKEEKLMREKEERERKEKEEEERKEKEEEERKEKNRRRQYDKENKEMLEIIKQQEKEEKELNQRVNTGTSWIEEQMSQMIKEADIAYSKNITFDAQKNINANYKYQSGKS